MPFWRISFALLARHLYHLFCYQVSCISANIISKMALILNGQEILFQSFLVRLGENLEFCFQLVYFFLDEKDNNKINWITVHPPSPPAPQQIFGIENNSSETHINSVKVFCLGGVLLDFLGSFFGHPNRYMGQSNRT